MLLTAHEISCFALYSHSATSLSLTNLLLFASSYSKTDFVDIVIKSLHNRGYSKCREENWELYICISSINWQIFEQ